MNLFIVDAGTNDGTDNRGDPEQPQLLQGPAAEGFDLA